MSHSPVVGAPPSSSPLVSHSPAVGAPPSSGPLVSHSSAVGAPPSSGPIVSQCPAVKTSLSTGPLVFLGPMVRCSDPQVCHFVSPRSGVTSGTTSVCSSSVCSPLTEYLQLPTAQLPNKKTKIGQARILTSSEAWALAIEKEQKKRRKAEEKENRKIEIEEKRKEEKRRTEGVKT